jgi:hypothetical protein
VLERLAALLREAGAVRAEALVRERVAVRLVAVVRLAAVLVRRLGREAADEELLAVAI